MNKIIVTGANGFIGKNVVSYLEDRNYVVIYKCLDIFMIHKNSIFMKK